MFGHKQRKTAKWCQKLVQNHIQTAKKTDLKQQTSNVQNNSITMAAGGVNRGASCMFALFIASLRLVLMGISLIKNRHHLTSSPLTATKGRRQHYGRINNANLFPSSSTVATGDIVCQPLSSASFFHAWTESGWWWWEGGSNLPLTLSKVLLLGEARRAQISFLGELVS